MELLRNYFSYNRLKRILIKFPAVFLIWGIYTSIAYQAIFPRSLLVALLFTVVYLLFTFNLGAGTKELIKMAGGPRNYLTFTPVLRGVVISLLTLAGLVLVIHFMQDHSSWQKSFSQAVHIWIPLNLLSIMHDVESWLIYKYGQVQRE